MLDSIFDALCHSASHCFMLLVYWLCVIQVGYFKLSCSFITQGWVVHCFPIRIVAVVVSFMYCGVAPCLEEISAHRAKQTCWTVLRILWPEVKMALPNQQEDTAAACLSSFLSFWYCVDESPLPLSWCFSFPGGALNWNKNVCFQSKRYHCQSVCLFLRTVQLEDPSLCPGSSLSLGDTNLQVKVLLLSYKVHLLPLCLSVCLNPLALCLGPFILILINYTFLLELETATLVLYDQANKWVIGASRVNNDGKV